MINGGFRINARFTPQRLIELTKMDGAIILAHDMKKINYANVLLTPDSKIKSLETGTRHIAAERTAKQTGTLVIAISERRNEITLYYKNIRYPVVPTEELLRKASEHIRILEKQRELFDGHISKLTFLELRNQPSLNHALNSIQRGRMIQKISNDLQRYIIELGKEGLLLKTRLKEIISEVENETELVIKDYSKVGSKKTELILESLSYEEIIDREKIIKSLGYENKENLEDSPLKGWRLLSKTSLSDAEIAALIREAGSLGKIINSNFSLYNDILGEQKSIAFKEEIKKIKLSY